MKLVNYLIRLEFLSIVKANRDDLLLLFLLNNCWKLL